MGECYWPAGAVNVLFSTSTWLAQTFTPLWTHKIERIRYMLAYFLPGSVAVISLQKVTPAGVPDGIDLLRKSQTNWQLFPLGQQYIVHEEFGVISLTEGTPYALVFRMWGAPPFWTMATERLPPPSGYPRGKLIRSYDGGNTWDTTDFGDLLFGEYGDPPLKPTPYVPPITHWGVTEKSQTNFYTSACIRVATTEPVTLKAYITKEKPVPRETWQFRRGGQILCLANYTFKNWTTYNQKEDTDSLYHTFYISYLKEDEPYWLTFIARSALLSTVSSGPIFSYVHPEAPPFTTIRRPDDIGEITHINRGFPNVWPNHYLNVNEATPDKDFSFVEQNTPLTSWSSDVYKIPDLLPYDFGPFSEVHLTARLRYQGGFAYASDAKFIIYTHGSYYLSSSLSPLNSTYKNKHWHLYSNPHTLNPWTRDEINALQIGISLQSYRGVGWSTFSRCTQVYCKITHQCKSSTV